MKKVILPCLISFIIMTISNCSFAVSATVNVSAVRIRESASTNSKIITNVYKDDKVEILEEEGEWCKVKYGENVGYAKTEFFTKKGEPVKNTVSNTTTNTSENVAANTTNTQNTTANTPAVNNTQLQPEANTVTNQTPATVPPKEPVVGEAITLQSTIKLRVVPNFSALAQSEIAQGKMVTVDAKLGNWYKITSQDVSGWVSKSKMMVTQIATPVPAPEPTPAPTPKPAEPVQPEVPNTPANTTPSANIVPNETVETPKEPEKTETQTSSTNKKAVVIVETARVRSEASTKSGIIDVLDEDDIVTITGEEGDFYKITCEKISSGYISKSLVKIKDVTSRSTTEERENTVSHEVNDIVNQALTENAESGVSGNDIVEFAKQYLGYKYVLGCSTPEKGFDCSGFTRYVYGHFGYKLGQVAAQQTSLGDVVERENLQIGDLILFYNDGKTKIGHCGIYMQNGDFIHSANPQRGVVIDNLNTNSYYNQRFVTARRVVGK